MPSLSDDKGKLFEILVGENIKGKLNHFRTDGKDPESIKALIKSRLESSQYEFIEQNSKRTAHQIIESIQDQIEDVAWSSIPSDHYKFTGLEDPNSDADLLIKTRTPNNYVGVSLKYGGLKTTSLRNLGFNTLGNLANTSFDDIYLLYDETRSFIKANYGIETHEQYKLIRNSDSKTKKEINDLIVSLQKEYANRIESSIKKFDSSRIKSFIMNTIAPDTLYEHVRVKCKVSGATSNIIFQSIKNDTYSAIERYNEFVVSANNTVATTIYDNKNNDKVLTLNVKKNNGPLNGITVIVRSKVLE